MPQEPVVLNEPLFGQLGKEQVIELVLAAHAASTASTVAAVDKITEALIGPVPDTRGDGVLSFEKALGNGGAEIVQDIQKAGRIVFHATGDTGGFASRDSINEVVAKLIADFNEENPADRPRFLFHLGDVVYTHGELSKYHDQFYEPFRNYEAPIFAIPGNHDGAINPDPIQRRPSLEGFLRNFCSNAFHLNPEAHTIARTTQIQPGVYFTLAAPFVRIIGLYSNNLGDPGVISDQCGKFPSVGKKQLEFLTKQLQDSRDFKGATLLAVHHPPFTFSTNHGPSLRMLADIDECCEKAKCWPHAILSGHSHNYERFTRKIAKNAAGESLNIEQPFVLCGLGGREVTKIQLAENNLAIRAPMDLGGDVIKLPANQSLRLENYFDRDYGYLRFVVSETELRIEFHDAGAGNTAKSALDAVTINLKEHRMAPS